MWGVILLVWGLLAITALMSAAIAKQVRGGRNTLEQGSPPAALAPRRAHDNIVPDEVSDAVARRSALARVDAVKQAYGAKLTDIAYVIENHALFDSDYPETVDFDMQLAIASESSSLSTPELFRAASRLERAWQLATANAERLGLTALKDKADDGRRAVGLARKANDTAGTPEGDALLVKLRSLLDVLGITLPARTRQSLEAGIRREIDDD